MAERTCAGCGVAIEPGRRERNRRKWCSETCRTSTYRAATPAYRERQKALAAARHREQYEPVTHTGECRVCGISFTSSRPRLYCTKKCAWRADYYRRRARRAAVARDDYTLIEIAERDAWTCALCGDPVDGTLKWPHADAASIDHATPLAHGGDDTRSNVQLAHLMCNWRKGDRRNANEGTETAAFADPKREDDRNGWTRAGSQAVA